MRRRSLLVVALLVAACGRAEDQAAQAAPDSAAAATPARVAAADGFATPESAVHDAAQDTWFVSNINGSPVARDNNGFISRLTADGAIDSLHFVQGGRAGVTLHAPKGLAITGDTLWVTDIDAVRGFLRTSGVPVAAVEFGKRARFLNDLAVGPDGALYVTDTGIGLDAKGAVQHPGPDRVYRIGPDRVISVVAEGDSLAWPNGITWDPAGRFLLVPFGGTSLLAWAPDSAPKAIGTGPGQQDGVEVMPDGRVLVSSWADSSVFVAGSGGNTRLITGVPSPADIGLDRGRSRVAIPLFMANRVELWSIPPK